MRLSGKWNLVALTLLSLSCVPGGNTGQPDHSGDNTDTGSESPSGQSGVAPWAVAPKMVSLSPAPTPGDTTLLNEVLFYPIEGQFQFVELKVGNDGPTLSRLVLRNEKNESYALPEGLDQSAPGGIFLVIFDGQSLVETGTVHSSLATFLTADTGSLDLLDDDGNLLDHVAWGLDQPDAVQYGNGGAPSDTLPGLVIARRPTAIDVASDEWTGFLSQDATAGSANHNTGMGFLFPTDGTWINPGPIDLSWYPVPDAASYQVQISMIDTFDALLLDQSTDTITFTTDVAAAGTYFWRVRPTFQDGSAGDFSAIQEFTVTESDLDADTTILSKPAHDKSSPIRRTLPGFPRISQHKDTSLLLLECEQEGNEHPWDAPHPLTGDDKADARNCSQASVTMINHYYGGTISQDRLSYEFRTPGNGPENDLNWGVGILPQPALSWALKDSAITRTNFGSWSQPYFEALWTAVMQDINADRPVILVKWTGTETHTMVAVGYETTDDVRKIIIHNPWAPGKSEARVDHVQLEKIPLSYYCRINVAAGERPPARDDEESITTDTDHDGVMDFDETMRFGTDPESNDTDHDCIADKDEIRNSILHGSHGWAKMINRHGSDGSARKGTLSLGSNNVPTAGRPELDIDSDGGGLIDSMEDTNMNGKYEPALGETDPFDKKDDSRTITGYLESGQDTDEPGHGAHIVEKRRYDFDLKVNNGQISGMVTYSTSDVETQPRPENVCQEHSDAYDSVITELQDPNPAKFNVIGQFDKCQTMELNADSPFMVTIWSHLDDPCQNPSNEDGPHTPYAPQQTFSFVPKSIESGTVVYSSTSEVSHPPRTGIQYTKWEIKVQR